MMRWHYAAFQSHKRRGFYLVTITALSILLKASVEFSFMTWRYCIGSEFKECEDLNIIHGTEIDCKHLYQSWVHWRRNDSYCHYFAQFVYKYQNPTNAWLKSFLQYLLPIWAFLLLNTPHDCFKCLGKDPDRIFSVS